MSIRINLDLEPEYEAFVKEWADKLGIPLSELMRRVVHETCNGYRYDEKFPTTTRLKKGRIGKDWTEEGTGERNVQQLDSTKHIVCHRPRPQ